MKTRKLSLNQKNHPNKFGRFKKSSYLCTRFSIKSTKVDPLAQSVEHNTFNVGVLGSNPKRITEKRLSGLFFLFPLGILTQGFFQSLRFMKATQASSANPKRITERTIRKKLKNSRLRIFASIKCTTFAPLSHYNKVLQTASNTMKRQINTY